MNPLATIDKLKQDFTSYLQAAFPIRHTLPRLAEDLDRVVNQQGLLFKGPFLELTPPYQQGATIRELVEEGVLHPKMTEIAPKKLPPDRPLYRHQEEAVRDAVAGRQLCIAAGTGAGKTECFLIPILDFILKAHDRGSRSGVKAVLMYPMNALVEDQLTRLRALLSSAVGRQITFGRYTGNTKETYSEFSDQLRSRGVPVLRNEVGSREQLREAMPDILLTNFSMLQYLLLRPKDASVFAETGPDLWQFLVLDEVHTYRGVQGIEVGMLMRRFLHRVGRLGAAQCIATSATLSSDEDDECLLRAFLEDVFHHSFEQPKGRIIRGYSLGHTEHDYFRVPAGQSFDLDEGQLAEIPESFLARTIAEWEKIDTATAAQELEAHFFGGRPPAWWCSVLGAAESGLELLFQVCRRLDLMHRVVAALADTDVQSITELAQVLDMENIDAVRRAIRLGTAARPDVDAHPLISARYHFFVRGPQGARVCLNEHCDQNPPPDLSIVATRTHLSGHGVCGCGHPMYEVRICRNCGQPYVLGFAERGQDRIFAEDDDFGDREHRYFLARPDDFRSEYGTLCSGELRLCHEEEGVVHTKRPTVPYRLVSAGGKSLEPATQVRRCLRCGDSPGSIGDAASRFTGEGDIAQVVLMQSILQSQRDFPKALAFSDSRQGAARFAVALNYTAKSALARQLILEAISEAGDGDSRVAEMRAQFPDATDEMILAFLAQAGGGGQENNGCGIDQLGRTLQRSDTARECGLFSEVVYEADEPCDARARVYAEFCTSLNRRLTLMALGLCERRMALSLDDAMQAKLLVIVAPLGIKDAASAEALLQLLAATVLSQEIADRYTEHAEIKAYYYTLLPAAQDQRYVILDGSGRGAKKDEISWLPRARRNARTSLVEKVAKANDQSITSDQLKEVLTKLFVLMNEAGAFKAINGDRSGIPLQLIKASVPEDVWQCELCGFRTTFAVKINANVAICPNKDCHGELCRRDRPVAGEGYYETLYAGTEPIRLVAREHTAQLGADAARSCQDSFANSAPDAKDGINVLSCSTTFEMGVDLGDLNTVMMRNIPPEVANYRQRAGRAGRRSGLEALIVTFARSRSHDAYYMGDPRRMIAGDVRPPCLNMGNPELRRRHVNAVFLGDYLLSLGTRFSKKGLLRELWPEADAGILPIGFDKWLDARSDLVGTDSLDALRALGDDREPGEMIEDFTDDLSRVGEGLRKHREDLEARFERCVQRARDDSKYQAHREMEDIRNEMSRPGRERAIEFLVKRQVLPGFGFPVHVVELWTRDDTLDLTRDKSIALMEYAPGSTIVANGMAIKSVGLQRSFYESERNLIYRACGQCGHVEVKGDDNFKVLCPVCDGDLSEPSAAKRSPKQPMLIPTGFVSDTSSKPRRASSLQSRAFHRRRSFVRFDRESGESSVHPQGLYATRHAGDAELFLVNMGSGGRQAGFRFCPSCRSHVPYGKRKHRSPNGAECSGQHFEEGVHLGHSFHTDSVRIRFAAERIPGTPAPEDLGFWRSLSYAVLKGAVIELQVERRDLGAVVQPYNAGADYMQEIVLYDAVPGGAGYCRYFRNHARIEKILRAALRVVSECECAPNGSCHRCLRTYDNAPFHRQLQRGPVVEFLNRLLAVIDNDQAFIPIGNAAYFIARRMVAGEAVSLCLGQVPSGCPAGHATSWIELFARTPGCRLLVARESFHRATVHNGEGMAQTLRVLQGFIDDGSVDLRLIDGAGCPEWNFVCSSIDAPAAIELAESEIAAGGHIERWTYLPDNVNKAQAEFDRAFALSTPVSGADIDSLLSKVRLREFPAQSTFDMAGDLADFYAAGGPIRAVVVNDRYLIKEHHLQSLEAHMGHVYDNASESRIPILVLTEETRDVTERSDQRDLASALEYRFPGVEVRVLPRSRRMVEHQRFVILAHSDGRYSRLTMDPGIDIIHRHRRDAWPSGPVFQKAELCEIMDYDPTGLPNHFQEALK